MWVNKRSSAPSPSSPTEKAHFRPSHRAINSPRTSCAPCVPGISRNYPGARIRLVCPLWIAHSAAVPAIYFERRGESCVPRAVYSARRPRLARKTRELLCGGKVRKGERNGEGVRPHRTHKSLLHKVGASEPPLCDCESWVMVSRVDKG